jgi:hypothetical protein
MRILTTGLLVLVLALAGCATESQNLGVTEARPVQSQLQFVDFPGFDRDLSSSLAAPLPMVAVSFYDRVTASAMPLRLQQWMASVEAGGGSVKVVPPKSTVSARSPMLVIGAISALYSASKMAKEMSSDAQFLAARAYDAEIILKADDKGDAVVDRVVFKQRQK